MRTKSEEHMNSFRALWHKFKDHFVNKVVETSSNFDLLSRNYMIEPSVVSNVLMLELSTVTKEDVTALIRNANKRIVQTILAMQTYLVTRLFP